MEIDQTKILARWEKPNPNFASGFDERSSDSGLLENFYGSYVNAKNQQWLNGGRALIDKTYLKMLWDCYCKKPFTPDFTILAQRIDNLLRSEFLETDLDKKPEAMISFIKQIAENLNLNDEINYTSLLLFFLKPSLPIIPVQDLDENWEDNYLSLFEKNEHTVPKIDISAFSHSNSTIQELIQKTNWLQRRYIWMTSKNTSLVTLRKLG